MSFDDGVVRRGRRELPHPRDFATELLFVILGKGQRLDAFAIGVRFALRGVSLPELVLNGAQLLAKIILAFATVDVRLDLALQLAVDGGAAEVARDPFDEQLDALDGMDGLEQQLLFLEREIDE
jgi:hypothetical protein